jgi:GT2 family glycosyltransferase
LSTNNTFLTIYTPTYLRPTLLERCVASVRAQTFQDVEHIVEYDEIGVGIAGMFAAIPAKTDCASGKYIYILQDDDILAFPDVVANLQAYATDNHMPEVIICRNRKRGMLYPSAECWERGPVESHIDLGSYIVRMDIFRKHANDFGKRYQGDFDFINLLWQAGRKFLWWDQLFATEQIANVPGLGRPEPALVREGKVQRAKR